MSKKIKLQLGSLLLISITACLAPPDIDKSTTPQLMRNFIIDINEYADTNSEKEFIIIPQNGQELITNDLNTNGKINQDYIDAIDATGREDLYYGYTADDKATPESATTYMKSFLDLYYTNNKAVLVIDYCSTEANMENSKTKNEENGFLVAVAQERMLDSIPTGTAKPTFNTNPITTMSDAKNFLYLINPDSKFSSKEEFLTEIDKTEYDLFIIDLFWGTEILTKEEIKKLQTKPNGNQRLLICYMSIGEAEDYRFYWQDDWKPGDPTWIYYENPNWKGNYKVFYWEKEWQDIIMGSDTSYLDKIIDAGFDGVYLDIVDAFEYFN